MPGFGWYIVAMLVGLFLTWAVHEYRLKFKKVRSQTYGFDKPWVKFLDNNIPLYKKMPVDLQAEFQLKTLRFLEHKSFVPCGGLDEVTDEMKVTIAANACLLVLNRKLRYPFHNVYSILVYPSSFFNNKEDEASLTSGEAWPQGSVIVAWDVARKNSRDLRGGKNLVVHEFAHALDMENGVADGLPILDSHQHRTWAKVLTEEFARLQDSARRGKRSVLDQYGADDPSEFFAVATEAFFEKSSRLLRDHGELYEQLRLFYRIDPVRWG